MNRGRLNWNNSLANVQFFENSTSNNRVFVEPHRWTALGRIYYRSWSGHELRRFDIYMNSRTIPESPTFNSPNFISSVFAHELGHAVGLRDNPVGGSPGNGSIMSSSRNRNIIAGPTAFDIISINILYSNN